MNQEKETASSHSEYQQVYENNKPAPWVERNGFAHWVVGLLWVILIWWVFQFFGLAVGIVGALVKNKELNSVEALTNALMQDIDLIFLTNTFSQIVVIGLATFLIVKVHASGKLEIRSFLRLKLSENVWKVTAISILLFIVVQPFILFLGWLNSFLPVPDMLSQMQDDMAEMISRFLKSDNALVIGVFHIGIVPAVCEEILFRGYFLKSLEKSMKVIWAILITSFIFGIFHAQLSNALPLATLGVFLAYVTYISDSLIPAMVAHFVNNGGQVIASSFYPEMLDEKITPEMEIPVLLVIGSIVLTTGLLYYLYTMKPKEHEA